MLGRAGSWGEQWREDGGRRPNGARGAAPRPAQSRPALELRPRPTPARPLCPGRPPSDGNLILEAPFNEWQAARRRGALDDVDALLSAGAGPGFLPPHGMGDPGDDGAVTPVGMTGAMRRELEAHEVVAPAGGGVTLGDEEDDYTFSE